MGIGLELKGGADIVSLVSRQLNGLGVASMLEFSVVLEENLSEHPTTGEQYRNLPNRSSHPSGSEYSQEQRSADTPLVDQVDVWEEGGRIYAGLRNATEHAHAQEFGTENMAARANVLKTGLSIYTHARMIAAGERELTYA